MVLTQIGAYVHDKPHVYFIQMLVNVSGRDSTGPVLIGWSMDPKATLVWLQGTTPYSLQLLATRDGDDRDVSALRAALSAHHIARGWYAPSPAVMDYVHGRLRVFENEADKLGGAGRSRPRPGHRRLTDEQAVEVFNLYHAHRMRASEIAAAYGVSVKTVGLIARGISHADMFRRVWDAGAGAQPGCWLISVAADPAAARYAVRDGRGRPEGR